MSLALAGVTVAYGGRPAVRDVSLEVAGGEWLALIGPNAAGKSTILRAIAGLVGRTGAIRLGDEDLAAMGRRARARRIALVEQEPALPPAMTVAEYVMLGRTPYIAHFGREGGEDRRRVAEVLERLELFGAARRPLGRLSGGERQRAALARALAQSPEVLLLDEPTSALDLGRQQQVLELVARLRGERGITVVSATHDLTLAAAYADRLALVAEGRLVALGVPEEVLTESRLARLYGASLRVVRDARGGVAVIPVRPGAGAGAEAA